MLEYALYAGAYLTAGFLIVVTMCSIVPPPKSMQPFLWIVVIFWPGVVGALIVMRLNDVIVVLGDKFHGGIFKDRGPR
jgi:hypothetical protein